MRRPRRKLVGFERLEERLALATYYVSNLGGDNQAGSSAAPWLTLQKAADTVVAGDTVIVRAGTYVGFDIRRDGAATSRITFSAEPNVLINQRNSRTPDGINLEGADYVTIEGFAVIGTPRAGIRTVTNTGVILRNNRCDQNNTWGILTGFSANILIENNECSRSAVEHGIYVSNSADNPTVRGNVLWGNNANGLHMNGDIHSGGGDGIISGALVENNIIYDNGRAGGSGINCDGVQSSLFRNNLIYNTHASGISLYRIDGGGGSTGNVVVNNTVLVAADGRWALNISGGSTHNTVRNNIFYTAHSFRGSITISADSLSGFTSNHNVVMDRFSTDGGNSRITLAQWRAATGEDQTSVIAAPADLFVNIAASNYRLKPGSAAIDAGTSQFAPPRDLGGAVRPQGTAVDIGAFESSGAPNQAPTAQADSAETVALTAISIDVLANDTDPDGDPLAILSFTQPSHGAVTQVSGGLRYAPASGYVGTDAFTYTISDGRGGTSTTTVSLDVRQAQPTSVSVVNGRLIVVGDVGSDTVSITGVGNGTTGQYVIVTIQGTQNVSGVTGDIDIDMHGGDDQVTIDNALVNGTISIDTAGGNDTITLGPTRIVSTRLALVVALGDGDDVLTGKRLYIGGNQTISGGNGNDQISFVGAASPGQFVLGTSSGGVTNITGDAGNDLIQAAYSFIVGQWLFGGGVGDDTISVRTSACNGAVSLAGGDGVDSLTVDTDYFVSTLLIDGGAHDDRLVLANSLGLVAATLEGGAGRDTAIVNNLTAQRLTLNTGAQNDTGDVRSSLFGELVANLGDHDDRLTLFGNLVRGAAAVDGGAGTGDVFADLGNTFRGGLRRTGFER
jgi:parallel beta-helix repeat protein